MTPRPAASLLAWLAVVASLACGGRQPEAPVPAAPDAGAPQAAGVAPTEPGPGVLTQADERRISLLFPSADGESLLPETRVIFLTNTLTSQVKQAVAELLAGPQGNDKIAAFPPSTPLRAVFLLRDGTAVIDLGREATQIPGGSASETDAVFALVDTLAVNFPEVKRVQILIEGEEVETLTGHLDTSAPLAADLKIVQWGEAGPPASVRGRVPDAPARDAAEPTRPEPAAAPRPEPGETSDPA
jgi:spore germination protein GerM